MFLEEITLRRVLPCTANKNKVKIWGALSTGVAELMPYINGTINSAVYNHEAGWLTYRMGEKIVTLYDKRIAVTKLLNEMDAYETLDVIKNTINEIEGKKDSIVPSMEMKKMPTPLDIFKLLPKKNCRECGEITCLSFAGKVLTGQARLEKCKVMDEPSYEEQKKKLEDIFEMYGLKD